MARVYDQCGGVGVEVTMESTRFGNQDDDVCPSTAATVKGVAF